MDLVDSFAFSLLLTGKDGRAFETEDGLCEVCETEAD